MIAKEGRVPSSERRGVDSSAAFAKLLRARTAAIALAPSEAAVANGGRTTGDAAALMERYCDGDRSAFRALYALIAPRMFAYLMCIVRDRRLAEELLQQTFVKLHSKRNLFARGADPIPWLYTMAHRTCLDEFRRVRRARARDAVAAADCAAEARAMMDGASEDSRPEYDQGTIDAVLDALELLPDNQRLALVLTKIQGRSMGQAAEILGVTPGAVKLRAHRGYVTLREMLRGIENKE